MIIYSVILKQLYTNLVTNFYLEEYHSITTLYLRCHLKKASWYSFSAIFPINPFLKIHSFIVFSVSMNHHKIMQFAFVYAGSCKTVWQLCARLSLSLMAIFVLLWLLTLQQRWTKPSVMLTLFTVVMSSDWKINIRPQMPRISLLKLKTRITTQTTSAQKGHFLSWQQPSLILWIGISTSLEIIFWFLGAIHIALFAVAQSMRHWRVGCIRFNHVDPKCQA